MGLAPLLTVLVLAALGIRSRRTALLARLVTVLMLLSWAIPLLLCTRIVLLLLARSLLSCSLLWAALGLLSGLTFLRFIAHVQCSSFKGIYRWRCHPGAAQSRGQPRILRTVLS